MSEPEVIMMDSDEAASLQQVTGWVSRQGRFFGKEERTARWDGCTHRACEDCGAVIEKGYCTCSSCRSKKDLAYYLARPRKPWDGKTMLYSLAADKYYHSLEEAEDDLEEHDSLEDLRLVICEPIYLHPLEADHWHDELPDDDDRLPVILEEAIAAFNKATESCPPLSYQPGRYALELEDTNE